MMTVRVDGVAFDGFTSMRVIDSVDQLCHQFVMECSAAERKPFPIRRGAWVEFFVDEQRIMTATAESIKGGYSSDSYKIEISGRDVTSEILKTDLPPDFVVRGPIQLAALMRKTLDAAGLSFTVIDEVGDLDDLTDKEVLTDDVGSSVWDFWTKLAEKRQVLITKNENADIVIMRPNSNVYDMPLLNLLDDPDSRNNILTGDFEWDETERRHEYNVHSQQNVSLSRKDEEVPADDEYWTPEWAGEQSIEEPPLQNGTEIEQIQQQLIMAEPGSEVEAYLLEKMASLTTGGNAAKAPTTRVATRGYAIDDDVAIGVEHKTAEDPCDDDECERLAKWNMNKARVKSLSHRVLVADMTINGDVWKAGYLIPCKDEIADIDSMMLIASVEYAVSCDEDGGAEESVSMTLTVPDGYTDSSSASVSQKQTSNIGGKFGAYQ